MAVADLNKPIDTINVNNDPIIVPLSLENYSKTLKVNGDTRTVYEAGTPIIKNTTTGEHYAQKITANKAVEPLVNEVYAGILETSISVSKPFATICVRGAVDTIASSFPYSTEAIKALGADGFINFKTL